MDGSLKWAVDVKLPGMVHARNVKPPFAGAKLTEHRRIVRAKHAGIHQSGEQGQLRRGGLRTGRAGHQRGQAAQGELGEAGHRARSLPRKTCSTTCATQRPRRSRNRSWWAIPDAAFAGAAKVIEAEYEIPFQGHTAISRRACHGRSVERPDDHLFERHEVVRHANGRRHISGHAARKSARRLDGGPAGLRPHRRRRCGVRGGLDLAKEIGRPVRVQWMRDEETAWDTKAPAFAVKMRGGLDAAGQPGGATITTPAPCDYNHVGYNEPDTVLIAQLMGSRRARPAEGSAATPSEMYAIPNRRMTAEVVSLPLVWETPLRTGNLRDPNGPQSTFASESFIDELAAAAKADPLEFRMKLLTASTDGRQRLPARPVHRGSQGGGGGLWLGHASFAETASATGTS